MMPTTDSRIRAPFWLENRPNAVARRLPVLAVDRVHHHVVGHHAQGVLAVDPDGGQRLARPDLRRLIREQRQRRHDQEQDPLLAIERSRRGGR
jgi:hypothetical protein